MVTLLDIYNFCLYEYLMCADAYSVHGNIALIAMDMIERGEY